MMYTALSLVFSKKEVCVKTQQNHGSIKHHDKTTYAIYSKTLENIIHYCKNIAKED